MQPINKSTTKLSLVPEFYVYACLDPRAPGRYFSKDITFLYKPFYIGKGKEDRMYDHLKEARRPNSKQYNLHKISTIRNILAIGQTPIIMKLWDGLIEEVALNMEEELANELKVKYGLTNIRLTTWGSGERKEQTEQSPQKPKSNINVIQDRITIYNYLLKEHFSISESEVSLNKSIYGEENISINSEIPCRQGARRDKARIGEVNGMFGKSAVKGSKWVIIDGEEKFLSKVEIEKLEASGYTLVYGRTNKPKGKRIIFEGEVKGKYRTDADIEANSNRRYQFGTSWKNTKPTYMNKTQIY